ncbi:hypothetical protein ACHAW5_005037 [Stephanodiscus triporus]|uniref:Ubiquitin-like domain-containing protein n=1 Tax=Stephanodiscus triporus TaxID=2934178 RepID=A0ABD3QR59_9STRA
MSENNRTSVSHHDRASSDASSIDLRIFIKDVHDTHGRKRPLTVRPWATVKDVKDQLTKHLHIPASSQCIYFGPVLSSAKELPNHRTLQDAGIYRNGETLLLEIKGNSPGGIHPGGLLMKSACPSISSLRSQTNDICVSSSTLDLAPKSLQRLVQQARRGLALGFKPSLAPDGSGGSYFLSDARKKRVGVFKPADEEPFAENNPRGYVPHAGASSSATSGGAGEDSLRQGIRPGELCLREVAAFLLDHDGFSGVPMTTLAEARHPALHVAGTRWTLSEGGAGVGVHSLTHSPSLGSLTVTTSTSPSTPPSQELMKKVGSFQEYIHAECTMDDISPSKISVDEVHKIAILDIRIMNADRNVANILCQRIPEDPDHFRLIPIDHGYSLRSKCDVAWFDWCWLDWPQMKEPLSRASRDYVLKLDIEADVRMLQERLNMQNDVLDYYRSSCQILKAGIRAGLTLYDICSAILCRNDPGGVVPSKLEMLTSMASELAMSAVYNGRFHHATASWALEEQLATRRFMTDQRSRLSSRFNSSKTRPVVRSASSSVFSVFTDELSRANSASSKGFCESAKSSMNSECPPGMVHASHSDNSSDGDDDATSFASECHEDTAAGEWAAALVAVADQSMDKEGSLFGRDRSISESSSDASSMASSSALSKSPVGFWHVRPGSSSLISCASDDDDEPISWAASSESTSHTHPVGSPSSFNCGDDSPIFSPIASSGLGKLLAESSGVASTAAPAAGKSSNPPKIVDDEFGSIPPPTDHSLTTKSAGNYSYKQFKKSVSYSDFTTHKNAGPKQYRSSSILPPTLHADDLFRTYFIKFVDLLVVREITMTEHLLHSKELKS